MSNISEQSVKINTAYKNRLTFGVPSQYICRKVKHRLILLLQGGFYSLGDHQFDIRPSLHRPEQAHVTRKPVVDKSKHFTRDRGIVML